VRASVLGLLKPPTVLHEIWYEIHVAEGHSEALYDFKIASNTTETENALSDIQPL
jgi:hypothetical protein